MQYSNRTCCTKRNTTLRGNVVLQTWNLEWLALSGLFKWKQPCCLFSYCQHDGHEMWGLDGCPAGWVWWQTMQWRVGYPSPITSCLGKMRSGSTFLSHRKLTPDKTAFQCALFTLVKKTLFLSFKCIWIIQKNPKSFGFMGTYIQIHSIALQSFRVFNIVFCQ